MGKILINGKQLEILTEHILLNEQTEADLEGDTKSDEERLGYKTSVESGEFETYAGGKPYELFLAKTDTTSKAYFEAGDFTESESKSLYYKYRRPNPVSIKIKDLMEFRNKWVEEQISAFANEKEAIVGFGKGFPKKASSLKKLQEKLKTLLPKQNFSKEFQYSSNDDYGKRKARKKGWEENPDYNKDGAKEDKQIARAKKKVGDVTFSPADRLEVMYQINEFVNKNYGGDYGAAESDKVYKRKGNKLLGAGWIKKGVEKIVLRPTNIKTKTETQVPAPVNNVATVVNIEPSDADKNLFLNNLWAPTPFLTGQLDEMVKNIKINQKNVSERFGGVDVKMEVATEICSGGGEEPVNCNKKIAFPFKIESSCSTVPNGVNEKGEKLQGHGGTRPVSERISFEQLAKNRANTAAKLVMEKLASLGIDTGSPIIDWKGENGDGTSGPQYQQGGAVESEQYKLARYVKIKVAIKYIAEVPATDIPEPKLYKVGDLKVVIKSDFESWDPWWDFPPLRWPNWLKFEKKYKNKKRPRGGYKTTECPAFLKNAFSGPKGNKMGSDISLKENINLVGKSNSGINIYEFDYKDKKFGSGRYRGVMAQEVPQASLMSDEGYLMVDYSKIDVPFEEI